MLFPLLASLFVPHADFGSSVLAAEEKKEKKYKNAKTRQRQAVGAKCGKALEKIQVTLEEELWAESLRALKDIEASSKTCKSDYEQTQICKFSGYLKFSNQKIDMADSEPVVLLSRFIEGEITLH